MHPYSLFYPANAKTVQMLDVHAEDRKNVAVPSAIKERRAETRD